MAVRIGDTLKQLNNADFPIVEATDVAFSSGDSLQKLYDDKKLGGGSTAITISQEEFDALDEQTKLENDYHCYDTGRLYYKAVQYGGGNTEELTMAEYKERREQGTLDNDTEYIVTSDEQGILLEASDIGYSNAVSNLPCTTVQGAVDKVVEKVDGLISDTDLTSTTSTVSANKIKNAVTYSFDTQSGNVKYVKFKPSITTISVVDIYGGKIEILGASKAAANPDYKTVKVVRLSYGDWGSYDATQVPSVVHTKIGELYYYPTDEYYYLKLYNYAAFTMRGLATAPEIITSLPAEESAMTLIPESKYASINNSSTSETSTWSSSKIASEIGAKITKTQYRGSRSIDISTGGKLTLIYSSEYASQAGCYMLLSNFNTEPLLIELGRNDIGQFKVTATHKSQNVDTITVTAAGDEYSWCVLQF